MSTERVTVFGAARSGVAAANLLVRRGASVTVTDREEASALPLLDKLLPEAGRVLGGHPESVLENVDYVVLSPGIPATIEPLRTAREKGIPVISEIELAFRALRGEVIAVTGSNGKSTTTALIGEILDAAGLDPIVAGNIGAPLSEQVDLHRDRHYVIELSSFQLETLDTFRADVAILLNITPDHLDRYDSIEQYAEAKYRIFDRQRRDDVAILNAENRYCLRAASAAKRWCFSSKREVVPGAWATRDSLFVNIGRGGQAIPRSTLKLVGSANVENALAAWLAARAVNVSDEIVARAFETFRGLPHRMETVSERDQIRWINDSKGTNVDATIASLEGLPSGKVILILGGRDKGGDFRSMSEIVSRKAKVVLTIGEGAPKIEEALQDAVEVVSAGDLDKAVEIAASRARAGDVVLLSPACASFDQYRDFEERGEHFRRLATGAKEVAS
ncbi:MAG: UDP-N-acetylmuramoyl-L-alanine--D-glutamate ligase [Acidobacteria bacterium]|nr:UDP-N-acetylmuramoyl-L-alanine--D-glutamate ligase [Acidobacteriota bacterium]